MNPFTIFLVQLIDVVKYVVGLYVWVIIIWVVLSWLVAFDVINLRNRFVRIIYDVINRLTEPVMRPLRRIIPTIGGLDLSPIAAFVLIMVLQRVLTLFQNLLMQSAAVQ